MTMIINNKANDKDDEEEKAQKSNVVHFYYQGFSNTTSSSIRISSSSTFSDSRNYNKKDKNMFKILRQKGKHIFLKINNMVKNRGNIIISRTMRRRSPQAPGNHIMPSSLSIVDDNSVHTNLDHKKFYQINLLSPILASSEKEELATFDSSTDESSGSSFSSFKNTNPNSRANRGRCPVVVVVDEEEDGKKRQLKQSISNDKQRKQYCYQILNAEPYSYATARHVDWYNIPYSSSSPLPSSARHRTKSNGGWYRPSTTPTFHFSSLWNKNKNKDKENSNEGEHVDSDDVDDDNDDDETTMTGGDDSIMWRNNKSMSEEDNDQHCYRGGERKDEESRQHDTTNNRNSNRNSNNSKKQHDREEKKKEEEQDDYNYYCSFPTTDEVLYVIPACVCFVLSFGLCT
mmetsp:Transcript_8965/g.16915  ORF Transcript_8965/g.16915 Transcript_8965/m.16915 type:complete len:401 (+) Transcript_8965:889-2091(+)